MRESRRDRNIFHGKIMIELTINDKRYRVEADAAMPLLWVLRDLLGLHGTKYACGTGVCGSCTVHIDGEPVRSCVVPVGSVGKSRVLTIEGLAVEGALHPVQQAWVTENVAQCGYCQPGQIMSAVALLNRNARPTDDEIDQAMNGNLCRCGTYHRIRKAIKLASQALNERGESA